MQTWPQTGIAQAFDRFAADDVLVCDHAINGRSTKSFIDEGRLLAIEEAIREGDFLFIQFGHNDEKVEDPVRYTDPAGTFTDNLKKFIDVARLHRAHPLLITPVERRKFDAEGTLMETGHAPYARAMLEAGRRFDVPVIDLWRLSRAWLSETGDEASKPFYMILKPGEAPWAPDGQTDNSHLKYEGAMLYAGMIAGELRSIGEPYSSLVEDIEIDLSALIEKNG